MFKKLWALYKEYEELINYIISGGLGTVVNVGTFSICRAFDLGINLSDVIAWVFTIIFVYLTSKFFVFKTTDKTKQESTKEFVLFVVARLLTLGVEILVLNLTIGVLAMDEFISKTLSQVIVIILNYLLSKLVIFAKKS